MLKETEQQETKGNPEYELPVGTESAAAVFTDVNIVERKDEKTGESFSQLVVSWDVGGTAKKTSLSYRGAIVDTHETGILLQKFRDLLGNQKIKYNELRGSVFDVAMRKLTNNAQSKTKIVPISLRYAPGQKEGVIERL